MAKRYSRYTWKIAFIRRKLDDEYGGGGGGGGGEGKEEGGDNDGPVTSLAAFAARTLSLQVLRYVYTAMYNRITLGNLSTCYYRSWWNRIVPEAAVQSSLEMAQPSPRLK